MPLSNLPVFIQTPKLALVQFLQGTDAAGTYKTLYTGATNGSKVLAIWENNTDATATHLITLQLVRSAVQYGALAFTTGLGDGSVNPPPGPVNVLSLGTWPGLPVDSDGNPYLILQNGDLLQATYATALTAAKLINLGAIVEDF